MIARVYSFFHIENLPTKERHLSETILALSIHLAFITAFIAITSRVLDSFNLLEFDRSTLERKDLVGDTVIYICLIAIAIIPPIFVYLRKLISGLIAVIVPFFIMLSVGLVLWGGVSGPVPVGFFIVLIVGGIVSGEKKLTILIAVPTVLLLVATYLLEQNNLINPTPQGDGVYLFTLLASIGIITSTVISYVSSLEKENHTLHELDRIKHDLIARASHEINTPLNIFVNLAEAHVHVVEPGTLAHRDAIDIAESARELQILIEDLLTTEKLFFGKMTINRELVEPKHLVREMEGIANALLAMFDKIDDVKFTLSVDENLPTINVDPVRVRQILRNLINNAVKFTSKGEISCHVYKENSDVCFAISDTGMGIPEDQTKRIFQRFVGDGMGQGLSIVNELTQIMGGNISVTSRVGAGSIFTVSFRGNGQ